MPNLFFNPDASYKNYGVDGDIVPVIADRDNDGVIEPADGDFVMLIFGMRRGGSAYYALDVTNKNSPKVKWRVGSAAFGRAGALNDPGDPRQVVFSVLPGHGVVIAEKWVPDKVPFQVIWEYMDAGRLEIEAPIPLGPLDFVPDAAGRMAML